MAKANEQEQYEIGFHKGSLNTLIKEREELARLITIVGQLMQMHLKALKELGIDMVTAAKKSAEKKKEPLESQINK